MKPVGINIKYNKQHMLTGANIVISLAEQEVEIPLTLNNFEEWVRDLPDSYFKMVGQHRSRDLQKLEKAYGFVTVSDPRTLEEKIPTMIQIKSTINKRMCDVELGKEHTISTNPERE